MSRFLTAVVLALFSVHIGPAAIELPKEKERWITTEADEFSIFSNAPDRDTIKLANDLLRMREALGKVTRLQVRSPHPTKVFIFRNAGSFAPYRDAMFGAGSSNVSGIFFRTNSRNFIILRADAPSGIDRTIYHEMTHAFVKNTLTGLPLWFDEGIAEYYSTFSIKGDSVNIGMPIPEHVMWLRSETPIPLTQLFAIDSESKDYHEGRRQGVFYAESWALVHYLMRDDDNRHKLAQYLALVKAKRPSDEAFHVAFGTSLDSMEHELRSYVRRFSYEYTRYSLSQIETSSIPAPQPMQRVDVLFELGDLLARSSPRNFDSAEQFLKAAIAANGEHAGAIADLGLIHDASGRAQEAETEYERAVQLGTREPDVYLTYGSALLDKMRNGLPSQTAVAKARAIFQKAAELDPTSALAFAGIGATYVVSAEDPSPGIAALEKSIALEPAQSETAFNLVQLYARAGRRDDAERVTNETIAPSGKAELLGSARRILAEIDRKNEEKQQLEALNAAVKLANSGKIADALMAIDKVLPTISDPVILDHAKQFRDQLSKAKIRK